MSDIVLPDMHDWTLVGVDCDWATAVVRMRFETTDGPMTLIASGTSDLHVPLHTPWGRSVSVNTVISTAGPSSESRSLRIEMQSGDVLSVEATSFEVR